MIGDRVGGREHEAAAVGTKRNVSDSARLLVYRKKELDVSTALQRRCESNRVDSVDRFAGQA
jgi:hypothetical protein